MKKIGTILASLVLITSITSASGIMRMQNNNAKTDTKKEGTKTDTKSVKKVPAKKTEKKAKSNK